MYLIDLSVSVTRIHDIRKSTTGGIALELHCLRGYKVLVLTKYAPIVLITIFQARYSAIMERTSKHHLNK